MSRLLLVLLFAGTAAAQPPARSGHSMTFDTATNRVLLFGGGGERWYNDLWAWDGARWALLAENGPEPRFDAVFGYDAQRQRAVLHGGRAVVNRQLQIYTDTWEWDGQRWEKKSDSSLGPRTHSAGVFDPKSSLFLVFGGFRPDDALHTDTWGWDGNAWQQLAAEGPAQCGPQGMVYDPARSQVVLLCVDLNAPPADGNYPATLWVWTGEGWSALEAADAPYLNPTKPPVQAGPQGGLFVFDSYGTRGQAAVTRRWDGTRWHVVETANPPVRNSHHLAYDPVRIRIVAFGGAFDGRDFNDTWEWDGQAWQQK